jgi:hypothetical protein
VRLLPRNSDTAKQDHVLLGGTTRGYVRFPVVRGDYFEIHFDAAPGSPVCVKPVAASDRERRSPWPTFALGIEVKGAIHACPLWSVNLPELLAKIRRKEANLIDVRAPMSATVVLQLASGAKVDRKIFSFRDSLSEHDFESQERAVADMVRAGLAGSKALLIDAGGFGRAQFPVDEPTPAQSVRPPTSLRSRWLDLVRHAQGIPPGVSRNLSPCLRRFRAHFQVERQLP